MIKLPQILNEYYKDKVYTVEEFEKEIKTLATELGCEYCEEDFATHWLIFKKDKDTENIIFHTCFLPDFKRLMILNVE